MAIFVEDKLFMLSNKHAILPLKIIANLKENTSISSITVKKTLHTKWRNLNNSGIKFSNDLLLEAASFLLSDKVVTVAYIFTGNTCMHLLFFAS